MNAVRSKNAWPKRAHKTDHSDNALIAQIAGGDENAFAVLSGKFSARILTLAKRMTGSAADADEILQETLLKIWMTAPTWQADGPAKFPTWLHRVVINACLDRKRRRTYSSLDEVEDVADVGANGFDETAAAERHAAIVEAMATLPDRQRSALSLHYLNEMSAPEAAKVLGVSVAGMESLLVRGKRAMRDALVLANAIGMIDLL